MQCRCTENIDAQHTATYFMHPFKYCCAVLHKAELSLSLLNMHCDTISPAWLQDLKLLEDSMADTTVLELLSRRCRAFGELESCCIES
jgi:hypothetical protein